MHTYAKYMQLYALYDAISNPKYMQKYAIKNMQKYAEIRKKIMQKYALTVIDPTNVQGWTNCAESRGRTLQFDY